MLAQRRLVGGRARLHGRDCPIVGGAPALILSIIGFGYLALEGFGRFGLPQPTRWINDVEDASMSHRSRAIRSEPVKKTVGVAMVRLCIGGAYEPGGTRRGP